MTINVQLIKFIYVKNKQLNILEYSKIENKIKKDRKITNYSLKIQTE